MIVMLQNTAAYFQLTEMPNAEISGLSAASSGYKGDKIMGCTKHLKHFNWITDTPCPYCRIEDLERENERDRCHGRDFIRLWKEGKERIAELEQQLSHYQGVVEVEGVIVHVTDWISTKSGLYFPLPEKPFAKGQRVHALVKEVE